MYIEPNSIIKILKGVPLSVSHRDVAHFNSKTEQYNYFASLTKYTFPNCQYVREQNKIRIGVKADNLYECNYIMFQNTSFGSKWFYAFITDVEYVNNGVSYISFEIDHMNTWLLNIDYTIKPSFVEREHVTDDSIGNHILDEGLALGEYVTNSVTSKMFSDWWICVGSSVELKPSDPMYEPATGFVYGGLYSGINWYCFEVDTALWSFASVMQGLASNGKADAIVSMFMIPKDVVSTLQNDGGYLQSNIREPEIVPVIATQNLNGYIPRNNKLLTYPYRALVLSNLEGGATTLKLELFEDSNPVINYVGGIQPNSTIIAYPVNYKGVFKNLNESVSLGSYPQCAWLKDVYAQWLASQTIRNNYAIDRFTRNAVSNIVTSPLTALTGALGGGKVNGKGMAGSIANGAIGSVNSQLDMYSRMSEEKEVHSLIPNSVNGTIANGSTNISMNRYGFQVECKSIRKEVAKSIDGYFDMYGYKVNTVKVPNINTRPHWNYVKTVGITIVGSLPPDAQAVISSIYNNGVTFWKKPNELGNYSLNNSI